LRRGALFLVLLAPLAHADPLPERSPRLVTHVLDVTLDYAGRRLRAKQTIVWRNRTKDTVRDIWLHLYWNAFRDDESTFALESRSDRRSQDDAESRGEIVVDRIRVKDGPALSLSFEHPDDDNDRDRTVARAVLPTAVPPGGEVALDLEWHSRIPRAGVRTGWGEDFVFAAQWFPKPGVYEEGRGWNCHQYHASTEYFADYGSYDVTLHVPNGWVVAASGRASRSGSSSQGTDDVHRFTADDVHDFAWVASSRVVKLDHVFRGSKVRFGRERRRLAGALARSEAELALRDVRVSLILPPEHRDRADRYLRCIDAGLELYGLRYGRYPYDTLTVVVPPKSGGFACCMEYPTLLTAPGGLFSEGSALEWVTMHEFGHQFFYGLVGSNEFETPWLDEGFTAYSTMRALETAYPPQGFDLEVLGIDLARFQPWEVPEEISDPLLGLGLLEPLGAAPGGILAFARDVPPVAAWPTTMQEPRSEGAPLGSLARYREDPRRGEMSRVGFEQYDHLAYRINAYSKTSVMLRSLERFLPPGMLDRILRTYSERFRFGHPRGEDFERVASEVAGTDLSWFFDQAVRTARVLDYAVGEVRARGTGRGAGSRAKTDVLVRRLGDFVAPVEVTVRFEDGSVRRERWDGQDRFVRYRYPAQPAVRSVVVDPHGRWALDVDRGNNSWRHRADGRAARRWALRLLLWAQHAMRLAGGVS